MTSGRFCTAASNAASSLLDKPLFLQSPDPPETGRFRQAHEAGEINIANAAVLLKSAQDRSVEFVDVHRGLLR
jgi:hypothetical protein